MRLILWTAAALLAAVLVAGIGGYALAHSALEVPLATPVHHDDFTFVARSVDQVRRSDGNRDVRVHLTVENDAKVVGYEWEPATAYVLDGAGRRYAPDGRSTPPVNIAAGARSDATLVFVVPPDARDLRLAFWDTVMMGDVFDGLRYARLRLKLGG